MTYHIYFRNEHGYIIGRDDYIADDDEHAMVVARALRSACSDLCTGIELWNGTRRVDAAPVATVNRRSTDEILAQVQSTVLEREVALCDSKWLIAESTRLLSETQQLLDRQRSP